MAKSKVYFTNLRASFGRNLLQKLEKLIKEAGIGNIDFQNKYAAIKIHFGEPGNLAFLLPAMGLIILAFLALRKTFPQEVPQT